jgi:hypothetical protein
MIKTRNGKNSLFWLDSWLYDKPLAILYSNLFKLCEQQMVTVDQVKAAPDLISFTRWLVDERRSSWEKILSEVNKIQLGNDDDLIR